MFNKTKICIATSSLLAVTGWLSSANVFAQSDEAAGKIEDEAAGYVVEEVFITGSRIKRSDETSAAPITVLTSENLKNAGTPTLEDFIQDLPSISGADYGSSVNNGNPGWATASLRGLGPTRTLVLINGRRPASAGAHGFVDLNTIPTSVVERIEVLRDGASTIYGSDAIAGVINIITKKEVEGLELDVQYDISDEGDGESYLGSMTFGTSFDRGSILLNAQYTKRADIWQRDRGFSECELKEKGNPPKLVCGGSATAYPGSIWLPKVPGQKAGDGSVVDPSTGLVREFSTSDGYNYAGVSYMVTPQEVYSFFGSADYRIIESGSFSTLSTFVEVGMTNRKSDQLLAPVGTFWGAPVAADHPNNPFGVNRTDGLAPTNVFVNRRLAETSGRSFNQDMTSWRTVFGLEGEFRNGWSWDSSFNYSRYVDSQIMHGRINRLRAETALSVTGCQADKECPELWNPFAVGTLSQALQDYMLATLTSVEKSRMLQSQLTVSGDFGGFELPGGEPGWAAGFERRAEDASNIPDGAASLGQIYSVGSGSTIGNYSVNEIYAEFSFPVLSNVTMAHELTVDISGRYTDYNFLKAQETFKYGINWAPSEDIRIRYTFAEGFRAPNIDERFASFETTAASYAEPCKKYGTDSSASPELIANCIADGLPANFTLDSNQATGFTSGNQNLKPETSESQNLGVVITPRFLNDFTATLDYFNVSIDDAIGTMGTDAIITGCYNSANFSSPLCNAIHGPSAVGSSPSGTSPRRDVLNTVAGQDLTTGNLATFDTSGVDFDFTYVIDAGIGFIELKAFGTWLSSYEFEAAEGIDVVDLAGRYGTDPYQGDNAAAFPEWKTNLRLSISRDNWQASLTSRFMSETEILKPKASNYENFASEIWYHDVQGSYTLGGLTLTAGVRNLLDEEPPYVTSATDMNTLNFSYDTAGRYLYTRVGMRF